MKAQEANDLALESLITESKLKDVFEVIKKEAAKGRGKVVYPYDEILMDLLGQYGYYSYKTSGDNMVICWNAHIENYWFTIENKN